MGLTSLNGVCVCNLQVAIRLRVFFGGLGRNHGKGAAAENLAARLPARLVSAGQLPTRVDREEG